MTRIAVLGASTPFILPLFDALADQASPPAELVLVGRSPEPLAAVTKYARNALPGWTVAETRVLDEALAETDIVVLQIRFGGLAGRQSDERIAEMLGVPADETLGPSGLHACLRMSHDLRLLAETLHDRCPGAVVLNLTNPVSVSTALLADASVNVLGVCELPLTTHQVVARILECDPAELAWSYSGLNHRGFLHDLSVDGSDVLPRLAHSLKDRSTLGVLGEEVADLSAVPLKYFGVLAGHAPHGSGRAATLISYREEALRHLTADPLVSPKVLASRPAPWYSEALVPFVTAIASGGRAEGIANIPDRTGMVREHRVVIGSGEVTALDAQPPQAVTPWLTRFEDHERAVLAAVRDPNPERVHQACALDPLLPPHRVERAVQLVLGSG